MPTTPLRLASAPCTWGVWERTIDRDDLVAPRRMLEMVREVGYTGIELGPPGYFGSDAASVSALLDEFGLALVGAFAPMRIASDTGFRDDLPFLDSTIDILAATGAAGPVVLGSRRERRTTRRRRAFGGTRCNLAAGRRPEACRRASATGLRPRSKARCRRCLPPAHRDVHREPRGGRCAARR